MARVVSLPPNQACFYFLFLFAPCSLHIIWKKMSSLFLRNAIPLFVILLCLGRVVRLYINLLLGGEQKLDNSWDRLDSMRTFSYCVSPCSTTFFELFNFCTCFFIQRWLIFQKLSLHSFFPRTFSFAIKTYSANVQSLSALLLWLGIVKCAIFGQLPASF